MELFEFLMVLVSIIVGLGIAEVLEGVARVLRARRVVRYYWVHGILTAAIFVALIQQWWEIWGLREVPLWSFTALALMLVGPICLFLIAHLMFPRSMEGVDLAGYYFEEMRPVWVLGIIAIIGSTSLRPFVLGDPLFSMANGTSLLGLLVFVLLFGSSRRWVHGALLPIVLAMLVYDVVRWTPVIG